MAERIRWFEAFPSLRDILKVPPTKRNPEQIAQLAREIRSHEWSRKLVELASKRAKLHQLPEEHVIKILDNVLEPTVRRHLNSFICRERRRFSSRLNKRVYAELVSSLFSGSWKRSGGGESPARRFLLYGETENLRPKDVLALERFFDRRLKKSQQRELDKNTVLERYKQMAEKLSWTFETEEERLQANKELHGLAEEKAEKSRYYSLADFLRMLAKGETTYARGVAIHLGWETATGHGERKRISDLVRQSGKGYIMAHEEGGKGIFFGHVSNAHSIQKHEFTHAARRVRGFDWLEDHDAVYSTEVLDALQRGVAPRTDIPKKSFDGVAVAYDAYNCGLKARDPKEAWRYLRWYYTIGRDLVQPTWQQIPEGLNPFKSRKQMEKWKKYRELWEKKRS